ncbi:MAG TPA: SRPBCC domain-containing protein [Actinomycetota bacterium]|jgi:uncharacterized protein YndB with AHSA1/START domain
MLEHPITRTITLRATPEEVWAALTDMNRLSEWFGVRAEIDPRRGGAVRFVEDGGTERRGLVEAFEPPHRLAFRWRAVRLVARGVETGDASTVEFVLRREARGTTLVVTESPGILAASGAAS